MRWKRQGCMLLWESKFDTKWKRKRNGRWRKGSERNYFIIFTDQQSSNGLAKCLYLHVLTKVQSDYQLGAALRDRAERAPLLLSTCFQFLPWQPLHRAAHNMAAASQQGKQVKEQRKAHRRETRTPYNNLIDLRRSPQLCFHVVSARNKSVLVQRWQETEFQEPVCRKASQESMLAWWKVVKKSTSYFPAKEQTCYSWRLC